MEAIGRVSLVRSGVSVRCPSCQQLAPTSGIKLENGLLCVACAAGSGAIPSQRPRDPFTAPKDTCPKCIAPRVVTAGACRKCGLVFKRFTPESVAPSRVLTRAWTDVAFRWSDSLQHARFQELAVEHGELAAAARLYEIWLAYLPNDPWGLKGKDELGMLRTIAAASELQRRGPWLSARALIGLASLAVICGTIVARLS